MTMKNKSTKAAQKVSEQIKDLTVDLTRVDIDPSTLEDLKLLSNQQQQISNKMYEMALIYLRGAGHTIEAGKAINVDPQTNQFVF